MGDSLPPPAEFDLVGSFARRRGSGVEIVLAKPAGDLAGSSVFVRLAKGKSTIDAGAELSEDESGPRLTVRAPRGEFTNGTWSMTMHIGTDNRTPLNARLLVQGERPIVLLWGAKAGPSAVPERRPAIVTPRRQAAHKAGLALDKALSVLPDESAKKVRTTARKTARRVLG